MDCRRLLLAARPPAITFNTTKSLTFGHHANIVADVAPGHIAGFAEVLVRGMGIERTLVQ